jgi:hypothetical protein
MKLKDYIQGKRHGKEANRLEREAMNDPFLNDAIDGFDSVEGDHLSVIAELEKQIAGKTRSRKPFVRYLITGIAASMALLIGFSIFMNQENSPAPELVQTGIKDTIRKKEIAQKDLAVQKNEPEVSETENKIEKPIIQAKKTLPAPPKTIALAKVTTQEEEEIQNTVNEKHVNAAILTEKEVPALAAAKPENLATNLRAKGLQAVNDSKSYIFTGTITDEDGLPLPGVSIQAPNSTFGAISDMDGKFRIEIPDTTKTNTLLAKYIGYNPQKISLSSDTQTIRMKPDELALNEVMVVGYGGKRAATKSLKLKEANIAETLQGRVAGLDVNSKEASFGEREFRKYFEKNRKTDICANGEFSLKARFRINESGKPANIEILNSDCDELKSEFLRLIEQSPLWTRKNREVNITLRIKN